MVGVYPTYVLRSGSIPSGGFLFVKSRPLFIKSVFFAVFDDKTSLFILKRPDTSTWTLTSPHGVCSVQQKKSVCKQACQRSKEKADRLKRKNQKQI